MTSQNSNRLYYKLFFTYTAVIVLIVLALVGYFVSFTRNRYLNSNLDYMRLMSDRGLSYLEQCSHTASNINNELYQTEMLMEDLLHYLQDDAETYQRYRLDTYSASSAVRYTGVDGFAEKHIDANSAIHSITVLSYVRAEKTSFYPASVIRRSNSEELFNSPETQAGEISDLIRDNYESFSFHKEIRDPVSRQSVGLLTVTFSTDKLRDISNFSGLPEFILISQSGQVLFDSAGVLDHEIPVPVTSQRSLESELDVWASREAVSEYELYTFIEKEAASQVPLSALLAIFFIGAGLILFGELSVHLYLRRLTKRLTYILNGMELVTTGDLSVRLKSLEGGDELDVISRQFNKMCQELERYIQKSYLAEIEQKNAEIEVLQNQINPHFLYNTLEAIRMKAICNGDREVGKMLYSMAVIFRSQLKDNDVIPLAQEIHYCKKYLELFEYRYSGKFAFQVNCPDTLMQVPVIKFIIQPVLENYFIHGIVPEREGNQITISIEQESDTLLIHVTDNGRGMTLDELEDKNREMREDENKDRKSIGLKNVNRRIKSVYGSEYGITLTAGEEGGLHVLLKTGMGELTNEKKSYAGGR